MTAPFVLDAWALLAWLQDERPAADRIDEILSALAVGQRAVAVSMINLGEVLYSVGRVEGQASAEETLESLLELPLQVLEANRERVLAAARLKMNHTISYADAFAAAAARELAAVLVTGDSELLSLGGTVRLEPLFRRG